MVSGEDCNLIGCRTFLETPFLTAYTVTAQGLAFCATFSGCIAATRQQEPAGYCKLQNANCKLFELPSSNLQFAIVILQFAFLFGHRSSLTSGLRAKPALPITAHRLL